MKKQLKKSKLSLLLGLFEEDSGKDYLYKDGFVYYKHWDGNHKRWIVSKYTEESWGRYIKYIYPKRYLKKT